MKMALGKRLDGSSKAMGRDRYYWTIPERLDFDSMDRAGRYVLKHFNIQVVVDRETGCWRWPLAINRRGHGVFWWRGSVRGAPRWLLMEVRRKTVSPLLDVVHKQRKVSHKDCCRPSHHEVVTRAENLRRTRVKWGKMPKTLKEYDLAG